MIFTGFCQETSGKGTIWIESFEAEDLEDAILFAQSACATSWDMELCQVHVLGIAQGDISILHWEDIL